jgi:hypothetical protein
LETVAEGIESESQAMELASLGCEYAQGYMFFKPLSAVAMTALSEFENQPGDAAQAELPERSEPVVDTDAEPESKPSLVSAFASPTIELPVQRARSMPPPTGQLPVVDAHPVPEPTGQQPVVAARQGDEPTTEMTHLLRPLLSN